MKKEVFIKTKTEEVIADVLRSLIRKEATSKI